MNKNDIEKINEYKGIIASNNTRIANLNNSIAEIERSYDSLIRFRKSVLTAQDNVHSITDNQKKYLSSVKSIGKNNNLAKNYGNGMSETLSGFGTKVVGLALEGLLLKIDLKLSQYKNSITSAEGIIKNLKSQSLNYKESMQRLKKK
ncbi:MAG: hypothetical protein MR360_01045 [Ruminococcus sp.]|nr:hypothetical protein [Ruminococcus sp.]MCI5597893.1 hypothetical protein [Ruminococcus sp.]